jgi:hypothetical protein
VEIKLQLTRRHSPKMLIAQSGNLKFSTLELIEDLVHPSWLSCKLYEPQLLAFYENLSIVARF